MLTRVCDSWCSRVGNERDRLAAQDPFDDSRRFALFVVLAQAHHRLLDLVMS